MDLPPQLPATTLDAEAIACSIEAAIEFQVPANIVLAIREVEGGRAGQWMTHDNGAVDIGPMQFNRRYLRTLAAYGVTEADVAAKGCYPYRLAAWRVAGHLARDEGDVWTRAANYHSRTQRLNQRYRQRLLKSARKWLKWLQQHFETQRHRCINPSYRFLPLGRAIRRGSFLFWSNPVCPWSRSFSWWCAAAPVWTARC